MNTDIELLELAAKAAGLTVRWHSDGYYGPTMEIMEDESGGSPWNPLTDDGDALRLAVKLCMSVDIYEDYVYIRWVDCVDQIEEETTSKYSIGEATRRAIVRAAAEIGKTK